MTLCTGNRGNVNYGRIASCQGVDFNQWLLSLLLPPTAVASMLTTRPQPIHLKKTTDWHMAQSDVYNLVKEVEIVHEIDCCSKMIWSLLSAFCHYEDSNKWQLIFYNTTHVKLGKLILCYSKRLKTRYTNWGPWLISVVSRGQGFLSRILPNRGWAAYQCTHIGQWGHIHCRPVNIHL